MSHTDKVDQFVSEVRTRLNRHLWWRTLCWSLLMGGAAMLGVGLAYVVRGYAVPPAWYPAMLVVVLAAAAGAWWWQRWTDERAELFIDRFFGLKDSVSSLRGFERAGRTGGFYELQSAQVEQVLAGLETEQIRHEPARALTGTALAAVALAAAIGFVGPSQQVVAKQLEAERVLAQTDQLNSDLEEYVRKMLDEADEELADLVEPNELREWVKKLEATDDRKEALRQYAAFEREINRKSAELENERDEQLLEEIGRELQKDREGRELGQKLERQQYREASDDLEKLTPEDIEKLEDVANERERLERLKKLAEQMASASRQSQQRRGGANKQGESGESEARGAGEGSRSESGKGTGGAGGSGGENGELAEMDDDLAEMLEELADKLDDYDEALGECEGGDGEAQALAKANQQGGDAADRLARIRQRLDSLAAACEARSQLAGLCEALGECQGMLAGTSPNPGGQKAGTGSSGQFNNQEQTPSDGELTRLQGSKGEGPSLTTVEDADSGTGVSSRGQAELDYEFERQVESFVQREDVPRAVRDGVKHYFENIHDGVQE